MKHKICELCGGTICMWDGGRCDCQEKSTADVGAPASATVKKSKVRITEKGVNVNEKNSYTVNKHLQF